MWKGTVVSIYTAPKASQPTVSRSEARAVAGRGLEGDRYFDKIGTFSQKPGSGREVTLIEIEAIEALKRDQGIELRVGDFRRNVVTRGVPLNHLVGREFAVGEARLKGIRLCEPCDHLEGLTRTGVKTALIHRGGLRAEIVKDGMIRVGDPVQE